jgi:16S rRNA (guanine527-N7)-methyltransferase
VSAGGADPFAGFNLERAIAERAAACGIDLAAARVAALARHARTVLLSNAALHLTSITEPSEFLERHLGESFEGAALLPADVEGELLDLGSGNGYPGLPLAAARPGLRPHLVEASEQKAGFLCEAVDEGFPGGSVIDRRVQRGDDLPAGLTIRVLVTRAAGDWKRVVPRLRSRIESGGDLLVWAGEKAEEISGRSAWRVYRLVERRPLPGRDRSWVWRFVAG